MNSHTAHRTGHQQCCHDDCELGLRNNYFEGKRLTVDSFRVEQAYSLHRRRLLNRAIHGWGVVYGFEIKPGQPPQESETDRLTIGPGLALDQCGRELLQVETPIVAADLVILDTDGKRVDLEGTGSPNRPSKRRIVCPSPGDWWLLSVHYAEQDISSVTVQDPCRCEHDEWDRTCETVRYTLSRVTPDKCCPECKCELECACDTSRCAEHADSSTSETVSPQRGGKHCLCKHLIQLAKKIVPADECGALCTVEESCGRVRVDLGSPVPLACVQLIRDDCGRWGFGEVEACDPRRLVKRNDLLFDLIRGCDLTRISKIHWAQWHRLEEDKEPVPFDQFSNYFGSPDPEGEDEYITRFTVEFSRPVLSDTLRADCMAMTVISTECEGGWWQTFRVPIVRLLKGPAEPDRTDCARSATIVVNGAWVEDGLRGRRSIFLAGDTRVEIEVRGDFITDCNGQSVDANAVGLLKTRFGNGTPGGTFLSTFRVAKAEPLPRPGRYDSDEQRGEYQ